MKNKVLIAATVVIVGSWLAVQLTRNHFRHRIIRNRHKQITAALAEIATLKDNLTGHGAEPASPDDLLGVVEIGRLQSQIQDLRTANAIDRAQGNANPMPEFVTLILLLGISVQMAALDRQIRSAGQPAPS